MMRVRSKGPANEASPPPPPPTIIIVVVIIIQSLDDHAMTKGGQESSPLMHRHNKGYTAVLLEIPDVGRLNEMRNWLLVTENWLWLVC